AGRRAIDIDRNLARDAGRRRRRVGRAPRRLGAIARLARARRAGVPRPREASGRGAAVRRAPRAGPAGASPIAPARGTIRTSLRKEIDMHARLTLLLGAALLSGCASTPTRADVSKKKAESMQASTLDDKQQADLVRRIVPRVVHVAAGDRFGTG